VAAAACPTDLPKEVARTGSVDARSALVDDHKECNKTFGASLQEITFLSSEIATVRG
jgi:hypothetical protein